MAPVKLITFDVMGTLLKPKFNIGKMYLMEARKLAHVKSFRFCTPPVLDQEFRKAFKHHWSKYPNFGYTEGMSSLQCWRSVVRDTFMGALERTEFSMQRHEAEQFLSAVADRLYQNFRKPDAWKLKSEDEIVLRKLSQRFMLGVISNFDERLIDILAGFKISNMFRFIVASKEVGVHKPNAEIFEIALHRSGLRDPADALHVGDNLELDYVAAQQAGWRSVWLHPVLPNETQVQLPPNDTISSLEELLRVPSAGSMISSDAIPSPNVSVSREIK